MQCTSKLFSKEQRRQIDRSVAEAEAKTSCEIVPVVATASGRYDRPEDMLGLWLAILSVIALWLILPRRPAETGSWDTIPLFVELVMLVIGAVVAFIIGALAGSRIGWLRRLFTPRKQMQDDVARRAREVFFDKRVHHTSGRAGLLIYVSMFEHVAAVLGDQEIVDNPNLGQPFLDSLCQQLTGGLRQGNPTDAICGVIAKAGQQLAGPLPRADGDVNELQDTLVLID
jgi:putative membrane protein